MSGLWRGTWATRLRIGSGLVLFAYALFHFLNIGLGLISTSAMDQFQDLRQILTRSLPGTVLIYGALLIHAALALWELARRRTLRMPWSEALQMALGLLIPLMLWEHLVHTRGAHQILEVEDRVGYIAGLIWGSSDGWSQSLLLLIVWAHGCIGLQRWLRPLPRWRQLQPWLVGLAVLVPGFALAGFLTQGRMTRAAMADADGFAAFADFYHMPDAQGFALLQGLTDLGLWVFAVLFGLAALSYLIRRALSRRKSVRIRYVDGPEITATKGHTLLEMSRMAGVPHTSLCGGKGRCTTCRVLIEDGADLLDPPTEAEQRSLNAVNAPPGTRLACQIHPSHPATVFRVFLPDGKRGRAHASQGLERRLAILFIDMRGFTARTTGQLPYDVVFLLNRFFDAIVPPILAAGGEVDKYLGDGLLAVFETADERSSARAGLQAVQAIGTALDAFNTRMQTEGLEPVRIGLGLHMGDLVLGEIGAAGRAPRTIIGAAVNAASRLEAMTKELGVDLLISDTVLHCAGWDPATLPMQTLHLRGVTHPIHALPVPHAAALSTVLTPTK